MLLNNIVWVPYGKENKFINGYDKMPFMSRSEYEEWLNSDVTLSNEDVIITINNNKRAGYICGACSAISFVLLTEAAVIATIHYIRYRKLKISRKRDKDIKINVFSGNEE